MEIAGNVAWRHSPLWRHTFEAWFKYSRCLKSGRPDFGVFETCPVVKTSGFQTLSEIRTLSSGFQTSGSNALNKGNRTISNRTSENRTFCPVFRHYKNPMCLKTGHSGRISDRLVPKQVPNRFSDTLDFHNVWKPDKMSGFQTHWIFIMSENRSNWMVFGRPITGCLKSGHFFVRFAKPDVRFSDIHCICKARIKM